MSGQKYFFSLSIRQPVNTWLCIGLMTAWCVWIIVYVNHQIATVNASITSNNAKLSDQLK